MIDNSIDILKQIKLQEFPLSDGGILYFSPETLGLLESDGIVSDLIRQSRHSESLDDITGNLKSKYPVNYIKNTLNSILELEQQGIVGRGNSESVNPADSPPVVRFVISNTSGCNLACSYCYNQFPENKESFSGKTDLSFQQLEQALKMLADASGNTTDLELLFIGGEPLLRFDLIQAASEMRKSLPELRNRNVRIFIITNGTLLDDFIYLYCSRNNIHIKISLDGNEKLHDLNRVFPGGKGSYRSVLEKLPGYFNVYRHPCKAVTATVNSYAQDLPALVDHFSALGFNQIELTELYGSNEPESHDILESGYEAVAEFLKFRVKSRQYVNLIPFTDIIHKLHFRRPGLYPCRTGLDSIALFSDGNFYACHHYMGDKSGTLGSLETGIDREKFSKIARYVNSHETCKNCWAKYLCGGDCYHRALVTSGSESSISEKNCIRKKTLIEKCIYAYYKVKETDPEAWNWYFSINLYP
ncbi:MAG: SPASM domain-containing protein [Firmicutes bacterium]|nr:SPASM domain-containing protein [Bacillota bacterium]